MKTNILLAVIVAGLAAGCGGPQERAVVRYGSTAVTVEEMLHEAREERFQGLSPEQKADFALRQMLMEAHLVADPVNDGEFEILRRRNARLASQRCLAVKLKQRVAASPIDIEAEAQKYFEAHRDEFSVPNRFVLDLIFIPFEEMRSEAVARDVLAQIERDPAKFAELARRQSRSETAATGGRTQPIPGTAVHPEVRRAVARNQGSNRPFLVTIDRGHYILRVVQFWPEIPADFDHVRHQVVEAVRRQVMDRLYVEALEGVPGRSGIEARGDLFVSPSVAWDEKVVAIGGEWYTVRDVFPGVEVGGAISGPVLGREIGNFHRWIVSSKYFECPEPADPEIGEDDLAASRLDEALQKYVSANLGDEIQRYHSLHGEALVTPPEFTFDLYVFPIEGPDPFAEYDRYRVLMDALQSDVSVDGSRFENAGVQVFTDEVMRDVEAARYDRILFSTLPGLDEGGVSKPLRAAGSEAWLMVRLKGKTDPRPLNPDNPEDLTAIVAQYVADSKERLVESLYETIRREAVVDNALLSQCVDALRADAEVLHVD